MSTPAETDSVAEPPDGSTPVTRWEQRWRREERPDVRDFLQAAGPLGPDAAAAVLGIDQQERWRRGERVPAEAYLQLWPALSAGAEAAFELVYGEYLLREESGETPQVEEYMWRFPHFAERLRRQVELHRGLLSVTPVATPHAAVGKPGRPDVAGYEILGVLGRGGMGVVYKARQVGLNRVVALKMILSGPDAHPVELARFRAEAEAVARLQHPNIVQIFEVGEHDDRPFLALEYVDGGSLAKHLAGAPQPARAAAELVETLARAMDYAHQRGVVHRDLKPANVLLATDEHGSTQINQEERSNPSSSFIRVHPCSSVAKITDFGLAKRLDGGPHPTQSGAVLGTPGYMAPEQSSGQPVGPVADVYSLGAILYEILTGRPPFQAPTVLETLQQVQTQEPVSPRRLQPGVPRDLDTICLKCLRKEPGKRYTTAAALADDLRRFLNGEPVRARPVGAAGRLWRWCRRRPLPASLAAALLLAVVGGLATVTRYYFVADAHRVRAEDALGRAEDGFRKAREAVDAFHTQVSESRLFREPGMQPLQKELLQTALTFYEEFIRDHGDDPRLRSDLGQAYRRLGKITRLLDSQPKAIELLEKAVAIFEELAAARPNAAADLRQLALAHLDLGTVYDEAGRAVQAEASHLRAKAIQERLTAENPDNADDRAMLAYSHERLAHAYVLQGKFPQAQASYEQAQTILEPLVRDHPDVVDYRRKLLLAYTNATRVYSHNLEVNRDVMESFCKAENGLNRAVALAEQLVSDYPTVAEYQNNQLVTLARLGGLYLSMGRTMEAEAVTRRALAVAEKLTGDNPAVLDFRRWRADVMASLGEICMFNGKTDEAEALLRQAVLFDEALELDHPGAPSFAHNLAAARSSVAVVFTSSARFEASLPWFADAIRGLESIRQRDPRYGGVREMLGNFHWHRAMAYAHLGRHAEAVADWDRVLELDTRQVRNLLQAFRAISAAQLRGANLAEAPLGDIARATAEANSFLGRLSIPGITNYNVARVFALASTAVRRDGQASQADEYAARAVELLQKSRAGSFLNLPAVREYFRKDTAFVALRGRVDFARLLEEIK